MVHFKDPFFLQTGKTNSLVHFFAVASNSMGELPFPIPPSFDTIVLGFSYRFSLTLTIPVVAGEVTVLLNDQELSNVTPFTPEHSIQSFVITISESPNQMLSFVFSESGEILSGGSLKITATPSTSAPSPSSSYSPPLALPLVLKKLRKVLQKVNKRDRKRLLHVLCRNKRSSILM